MGSNFCCWPIGEVAARLAKVRLAGYSGRDLLTLSSSRFDPKPTIPTFVVISHSVASPFAELDASSLGIS
jgi:hypothetical protein